MPASDPSRRHASPPRTLHRFAVVMAALLALAALPQSALFVVDRVEVTGISSVPADQVLALAALRRGERLFAVDAEAVARRLRADPRIRAAEVRVRPPRTVGIAIVERRPVIALAASGAYALVAEDLIVVEVRPDPGALPAVVDRTGRGRPVVPGAPASSAAVRAALDALPLIPPELRGALGRIVVAPGGDLTLVLRSGLRIRAGGQAGLTERLARVPQVLAVLRARGVVAAAVDLRYAGSIAVQLDAGRRSQGGVE
ncbi:MAG: FtsQ-type POTRA domain-containing protein [Armatimonadota bacterium]|nr:FtsQ-type POTRA domain-containing protein [Armatimonadota bacterium]